MSSIVTSESTSIYPLHPALAAAILQGAARRLLNRRRAVLAFPSLPCNPNTATEPARERPLPKLGEGEGPEGECHGLASAAGEVEGAGVLVSRGEWQPGWREEAPGKRGVSAGTGEEGEAGAPGWQADPRPHAGATPGAATPGATPQATPQATPAPVNARRPASACNPPRAPSAPRGTRPASARPVFTGRSVSAGAVATNDASAGRDEQKEVEEVVEVDCRSVAWDGRTFRMRGSGLPVTSIGMSEGNAASVRGRGAGDGGRWEDGLRGQVANHLRLNLDLATFLNPTPRARMPQRPATAHPAQRADTAWRPSSARQRPASAQRHVHEELEAPTHATQPYGIAAALEKRSADYGMVQIVSKYASTHSRGGWAVEGHNSPLLEGGAGQEGAQGGSGSGGGSSSRQTARAGGAAAPALMHRPDEADEVIWQPSARPAYYNRVISSSHDRHFPAISRRRTELIRPSTSPQRRLGSKGLGADVARRRAVSSASYPPKLSNREKQILEQGVL